MGGVSRVNMRGEDAVGVFIGKLSIEHGGAIDSVRREPEVFELGAYLGSMDRRRSSNAANLLLASPCTHGTLCGPQACDAQPLPFF